MNASLPKYPIKMLPNDNKNNGKPIRQEGSCAVLKTVKFAFGFVKNV